MDRVNKFVDDLKKKNIFGNSSGGLNLPMASGNSRGNGVSFSTMNVAVLLSIIWLLASIGLFGLGIWHCGNRSNKYILSCDEVNCDLFHNQNLPIKFLRKDLTTSNVVRINQDGDIVDTSRMKAKAQRSIGHSIELKFQYAEDPTSRFKAEKKVLFATEDMGSGHAKKINKQITKMIYKPNDPIYVKHGFSVTLVGVLGIIFGILSSILSLVFGQWQDVPRRLKKSS